MISDETRAKMSESATARRMPRKPCSKSGCTRTVTTRSKTGLCRPHGTRAWKQTNPQRVNAHNRRYNAAHPEVMTRARSKWDAAHPFARADRQQVRRARKAGQFVEKVYKSKVLRLHGGRCGVCGFQVDPADWHLDHIIPLSKGGEHSYANTQPAHPLCNLRKGASIQALDLALPAAA